LVDAGNDAGGIDDFGEVSGLEVRYADGLDASLLQKSDEAFPRFGVLVLGRDRPVAHEHVEVVEAETAEAVVVGALHPADAVEFLVEFAGDEQLTARYACVFEGTADGFFVPVGERGVEQPVARQQGMPDSVFAFLTEHRPGSQPKPRNAAAVAQDKPGYCGQVDLPARLRRHGWLSFLACRSGQIIQSQWVEGSY
jgi:hypothetical protein